MFFHCDESTWYSFPKKFVFWGRGTNLLFSYGFPHISGKEERTRLSPGALQLLVGSLHGEGRLGLLVNHAQ